MTTRQTSVRSALMSYLLALCAVAAAVAVRWLMDPWFGVNVPYITMFAAVAFCAWYCGVGPALLAMVAGGLICSSLFLPARLEPSLENTAALLVLLVYGCGALLIILLGDYARRRGEQAGAATRELREQQALLQLMVDALPMLISYIGRDGRYEFNNRAYERWFGESSEAMRGRHMRDVLGEAAYERVAPAVERALAGETVRFEGELDYRNAGVRRVEILYQPHRVEGDVRGFFVVVEDVTDRRRAESARSHLAAIFENADDAVISKTLDGIVTSWNAGAERLFGYRPEDMVGASILRLIPPDLHSEEVDIVARLRQGERIRHYETERLARDGRRIPVSLTVSPIRDADGRIIGASKIARDISERIASDQRFAEVNRRKDEFIATLAHELRNPLAPILNAAQFLRLKAGQEEGIDASSGIIERQARHMTRLVDDLLDVSRVSRGEITLRRETVSLTDALASALEVIRSGADTAGQTLRLDLPVEPVYVHGDLTRLSQVFGNLLSNAVKYTPRGGHIGLSLAIEDDDAVVRVTDTGIGIPRHAQETIFEMFVQVDASLERRQVGLGIGLTLARKLVQLHGGALSVSSAGEGRGSEFVVRLPRAIGAPDETSSDPVIKKGPMPLRVLLVDDSDDVRRGLELMLEVEGHQVHTAHDGLQAVDVAPRVKPDVVLMDIGMPNMNGYDAARLIRTMPLDAQPWMIALTGWGQDDDRRKALEAGFDEHYTKPIEYRALVDALEIARLRLAERAMGY